jgi:hypothetical protein
VEILKWLHEAAHRKAKILAQQLDSAPWQCPIS